MWRRRKSRQWRRGGESGIKQLENQVANMKAGNQRNKREGGGVEAGAG